MIGKLCLSQMSQYFGKVLSEEEEQKESIGNLGVADCNLDFNKCHLR